MLIGVVADIHDAVAPLKRDWLDSVRWESIAGHARRRLQRVPARITGGGRRAHAARGPCDRGVGKPRFRLESGRDR